MNTELDINTNIKTITVTIIRHAQTKYNANDYTNLEEIRNSRLTEFGRTQAKSLDYTFDILILSPLKRALETYTNSNIKTKEIIINDLFREQKDEYPIN